MLRYWARALLMLLSIGGFDIYSKVGRWIPRIFGPWTDIEMAIRCGMEADGIWEQDEEDERVLFFSSFLSLIFLRPFRCEECDSRFRRWSITEKPGPDRPIRTS